VILSSLNKYRELGLLILRVGLGAMFIVHGWPKIQGGPPMWTGLGGAMANIGITFQPVFWGFMAAVSEFGGGICLVLGLATRPAALLMAFTMAMAALSHLKGGDGVMKASHAIECGSAFLAIVLLGAGKYSLDKK
jgi:putative oxidoreductase